MCGNGSGSSAGDSFDAKAAATDRSVAARNRSRGGTAVADSDGIGARFEARKNEFTKAPGTAVGRLATDLLVPAPLRVIGELANLAGATPAVPDGTVVPPEETQRDGNEMAGAKKIGGGPTGGGTGGGNIAPPSPVRTVLAGRRFGELGGGNIRRKVLLGA